MRGPGLDDGSKDEEGGRLANRSPSSRRASVRPQDDSPLPLGPGMEKVPERRTERPQRGMYDYWMSAMLPVTSGKLSTPAINRAIFGANTKTLRERDGLTNDQIRTLITEFARQVRMDRIDIRGKAPWFVFMARWQTLTNGNASSMGLAERMADLDDDGSRWT